MPSSFAHYAIGALAVTPLGLRGRERALVALWAVAPDLDVVPAATWLVLAPHLPLGADVITQTTYLVTHRGFSHSLLAVPLVLLAVRWRTRERRFILGAGAAWASHILLDLFTPWRVVPLWPLTTWEVHMPLITGLDPLLTLAALVATVALLGQTGLPRRVRLGCERHERLARWGRRWATPACAATLGALAIGGLVLAVTAGTTEAGFGELHPAGTPRSLALLDDGDVWRIERRWHPWDDPHVELVRKADTGRAHGDVTQELAQARCVLDHLGPYSPVDQVAWTAFTENGTLTLRALDVVRNATREGGPAVVFMFEASQLTGVHFANGSGDTRWFRVAVPQALVEAAPCP